MLTTIDNSVRKYNPLFFKDLEPGMHLCALFSKEEEHRLLINSCVNNGNDLKEIIAIHRVVVA